MLAQGQSSSAKRGGLAADGSSGLIFLKKKKKSTHNSEPPHESFPGDSLGASLCGRNLHPVLAVPHVEDGKDVYSGSRIIRIGFKKTKKNVNILVLGLQVPPGSDACCVLAVPFGVPTQEGVGDSWSSSLRSTSSRISVSRHTPWSLSRHLCSLADGPEFRLSSASSGL